MSNHDEKDLLATALRERTTGIGGHPISLGEVKGRARHIRRRRNAVRGAVAAVVAAIVVPTGMNVTTALNAPGSVDSPPVANSAAASDPPRPQAPTGLTLTGLSRGTAPQVSYLDDANHTLVTPEGVVHLDSSLTSVLAIAPLGDGWQAVAEPGPAVYHLDAQGAVVSKEQNRAGRTMAVANDGSRVAYTLLDADGTQVLYSVPTSGNLEPVSWRLPDLPEITPVGFLGSDTVVFETDDQQGSGAVYTVGTGSQPKQVPGLVGAADAGDGLVLGTTSVTDEGACSAAVQASTAKQLWETCDYSLLRGGLSPNGQWMAAGPAYMDGYGPLSTAILDVATGKPVAEYEQASQERQVTLMQEVWESDDTLLAVLANDADFAIARLGVDGRLELAAPPVTGEAYGPTPLRFTTGY